MGTSTLDSPPIRSATDEESVGGDHALLARARRGDRVALEALWEANRRWVAVVLLAHKPAEIDLDDLMQDVAVTLVTRLDDLRDDDGFRGWLRMVAVNAARAAARSAGIRRMHRLDASGDEDGLAEPACGSEHPPVREDARHLLDLSLQLSEEYREPLLLKSLHSLSYRQIGVLLDLPETTVETRITRARRRLRELARQQCDWNHDQPNPQPRARLEAIPARDALHRPSGPMPPDRGAP